MHLSFFIFRAKRRKLIHSDVILHWYFIYFFNDTVILLNYITLHRSFLPLKLTKVSPLSTKWSSKFLAYKTLCTLVSASLWSLFSYSTAPRPIQIHFVHWQLPEMVCLCSCCSFLRNVLPVLPLPWCPLIHFQPAQTPCPVLSFLCSPRSVVCRLLLPSCLMWPSLLQVYKAVLWWYVSGSSPADYIVNSPRARIMSFYFYFFISIDLAPSSRLMLHK